MLVDNVTKQTYSCSHDAIRVLGKKEFNRKVRNNEIDYVQCRVV